ncbi:hypothetical protein PCL1606_56400 [Pseudomonas chlororaphis]|uniref:Uncharacterized protein n=1 Tax=Pseudomonas chlororaphis TaxID=587753 RepID=A0A0D5Y6Z9_9PSED|nr:hypothetical protein PCL1606_56400 [Pseudomonas chlororaphis]
MVLESGSFQIRHVGIPLFTVGQTDRRGYACRIVPTRLTGHPCQGP